VLLQNGIPVRLIERDSHYRIGQKGAGILVMANIFVFEIRSSQYNVNQPRTVELHRILGTYEEFDQLAGPMPLTRLFRKGDVSQPIKEMYVAQIGEPTPSVPLVCRLLFLSWISFDFSLAGTQPFPRTLGQDSHEALLRARIEALGGVVELSTSLVSFETFDDHVLAHLAKTASNGTVTEETVDCQFLIGTEGAHSIVRKKSGMTFLGESMPTTTLVIGDIDVKRGIPKDVRKSFLCCRAKG